MSGIVKMLEINDNLSLPEGELSFTATTSSGPGGQNVNKVSTRVVVSFDVAGSPTLTDDQKNLILRRLQNRVTKEGVLKVASQETRSQWANREAALRRLAELLRGALKTTPPRKRTKISVKAKKRRLEAKRHRGLVKSQRSGKSAIEEY